MTAWDIIKFNRNAAITIIPQNCLLFMTYVLKYIIHDMYIISPLIANTFILVSVRPFVAKLYFTLIVAFLSSFWCQNGCLVMILASWQLTRQLQIRWNMIFKSYLLIIVESLFWYQMQDLVIRNLLYLSEIPRRLVQIQRSLKHSILICGIIIFAEFFYATNTHILLQSLKSSSK